MGNAKASRDAYEYNQYCKKKIDTINKDQEQKLLELSNNFAAILDSESTPMK